jgi:hypothetical protein
VFCAFAAVGFFWPSIFLGNVVREAVPSSSVMGFHVDPFQYDVFLFADMV